MNKIVFLTFSGSCSLLVVLHYEIGWFTWYSKQKSVVIWKSIRFLFSFISLNQIIFVLRKKDDQITFLHVYHHATMVVFSWWGLIYVAGGQCKIVENKQTNMDFLIFSSFHCNYQFIYSCDNVHLLWSQCLWTKHSKISLVETLLDSSTNCKFKKRILKYFEWIFELFFK